MDDNNQYLDNLRAEMKELARRIENASNTSNEEISSQVKNYMEKATNSLKDNWQMTKKTATEKSQQAQEYAHENPWHVAGMAAAVGVVIGLLVGSRRD